MNGILRTMWKWTVVGYVLITFLIFVPMFNWMYITNHSYINWMRVGVFKSTARALAWPVFIRDLRETDVVVVKDALLCVNRVMVGLPRDPKQFTQDDFGRLAANFNKALVLAEQVDCDFLNQSYPEMGDRFQKQFRKGLHLSRDGINAKNFGEMCSGFMYLELFGDWYTANIDALNESV